MHVCLRKRTRWREEENRTSGEREFQKLFPHGYPHPICHLAWSVTSFSPSLLSVRHLSQSVSSPWLRAGEITGANTGAKTLLEERADFFGMRGLIFHNACSDQQTKTKKTHLRRPSLRVRPTIGVLILELRDDCALPSRCDPLLPSFSLSRSSALLMSCVCCVCVWECWLRKQAQNAMKLRSPAHATARFLVLESPCLPCHEIRTSIIIWLTWANRTT